MLFLLKPPITKHLAFLRADFATVLKGASAWLEPQGSPRATLFSSSLEEAFERLFPLTGWRLLIVDTSFGWSAVFKDADDVPEGPVGHLSQELKCKGVIGTYIPDSGEGQSRVWGAVQLSCYEDHPTDFLNTGRCISVTNWENGWEFEENADRLPFEDAERYTLDSIRERFTVDMLVDYLSHMGIDATDVTKYGPQCALFDVPPDIVQS